MTATTYLDSGVDLGVAESVSAWLAGSIGTGLFGGFLPLSGLKSFDAPVLVTSIDGIGTKVRLAGRLGLLDGLGRDIVHHCVNDIIVHGAVPLAFLDYLAFHRVDAQVVQQVVGGISEACGRLGIRLLGGETAEMPSVYNRDAFDIAGAIVGVVEQSKIIDGRAIQAGDVIVGLPSAGIHTNGFALVQTVFGDDDYKAKLEGSERSLGEALLEPHRCYSSEVSELVETAEVHGLAHITGGGIAGNIQRILPSELAARVQVKPSTLFRHIENQGVERSEMERVFNLGLGMLAMCGKGVGELPGDAEVVGEIVVSDDKDRRVQVEWR